MSLVLTVARIYLPPPFRKNRLRELFQATADAFQCQAPEPNGNSVSEYLTKYAVFTAENAGWVLRQGNELKVKEQLYCNARRIGEDLRQKLSIRTCDETMLVCEVIYKALNIEFHGNSLGQIQITKCFFSSFYTGNVCRIVSALDEGLVAGLSGGQRLEFSQRITEGSPMCKARLLPAGSLP